MKKPTRHEKPKIVKLKKMSFPMEVIKATRKGIVCKQCSSCHGCR